MTTKNRLFIISLLLVLSCCWALPAFAGDAHPVMRPDHDELRRWLQLYKQAPIRPAASLDALDRRASLSLLSLLEYIPEERNQGQCGNCWVWSATAALAMGLNSDTGVKDRLSVQYMSSCNTGMDCCAGGWLTDFRDFYTTAGYAIPWSNTNAFWRNGDGACNVECQDIGVNHQYKINDLEVTTIETIGAGQEQAVANIKAALDDNLPVWFVYYLPDEPSWTDFHNFWGNDDASSVFDFGLYSGKSWVDGEGAGHAVLIVGYNDDVETPYWVVLNSWGVTEGRPDGVFRMKMFTDYDSYMPYEDVNYSILFFQTLTADFDDAAFDCPVALDPPNRLFTPFGGESSITVTAADSCSWTVEEDLDWVVITSGESGTGSGEISFLVGARTSDESRSGTITVGEETVGIIQYGTRKDSLSAGGCFIDWVEP